MRFLLDTHVWLWLLVEPDRLPAPLVDQLATAADLVVSAVSVWEVVIKTGTGRLDLPLPAADLVTATYRDAGMRGLPVEARHALGVRDLPPLHRDPFDRLLVAQARGEELTLVTADAKVQAYDVALLPVQAR